MASADDPRIGSVIAGFRIESLIGRGGMGVVYLAEQLRYGRRVALKLLAPELSADPGFRERFEQEWRTAARLEHPNIVPVHEADEVEGVLYIAMRYVEGTDLKAVLEREGSLTPERALAVVGQVGAALDAAHAHGLVHRDVKPANILIGSVRGISGDHVYLADFGVAKQTRTPGGLTKTGLFIGTIDYAAPEQIEGKPLDGRADIYSLGCVLYQCLSGEPPFAKDSEVAMLYAHLLEPPPRLSEKRPDLPLELDEVIAKALAKSRDDRYATGEALVSAGWEALAAHRTAVSEAVRTPGTIPPQPMEPATLQAAQPAEQAEVESGRPPAAGPPGPPPPPSRRPWWRSRAALAGLAALVLAGIGAGVGIALAGGDDGSGTEAASSVVTDLTTAQATTSIEAGTTAIAAATLTKQEWIAAADVICTEADNRIAMIPAVGTLEEHAAASDQLISIGEEEVAKLEALAPPAAIEDDVAAVLDLIRQQVDVYRQESEAASAGDQARVDELGALALTLAEQTTDVWERIDTKTCGTVFGL